MDLLGIFVWCCDQFLIYGLFFGYAYLLSKCIGLEKVVALIFCFWPIWFIFPSLTPLFNWLRPYTSGQYAYFIGLTSPPLIFLLSIIMCKIGLTPKVGVLMAGFCNLGLSIYGIHCWREGYIIKFPIVFGKVNFISNKGGSLVLLAYLIFFLCFIYSLRYLYDIFVDFHRRMKQEAINNRANRLIQS